MKSKLIYLGKVCLDSCEFLFLNQCSAVLRLQEMGYCTVSVSSALLYRRKHCKLPTPSIQRNLRELRNTHNSIGHYNTSNCIIIRILAKVRSSP